MRITVHTVFTALAISLQSLAACSQPEAPETTTPATAAVEPVETPEAVQPEVAPVSQETTADGVTFTITQVQGDCNPETPYRAKLSWTIADVTKAAVQVRVDTVDGPLMATITSMDGSAETGDWVKSGGRFFLVNIATGEALATVTSGPETCN